MFSRCVAPRRFFYPLSRCSHPADPRLDSSVTSKMLLRSLSLAPNAAAHRERDARHGLQKCARSSAAFERHCIRRGRPCLAGHEMDLSGFAPGLDGFDHVWGGFASSEFHCTTFLKSQSGGFSFACAFCPPASRIAYRSNTVKRVLMCATLSRTTLAHPFLSNAEHAGC